MTMMHFNTPLRLAAICAILPLMGCTLDSPALGFGRASFTAVEVQGDKFKVYTEETRNCVEVHRVNPVFPPPSRLEIMIKSEIAVKQVTGCLIEEGSFIGDQAMQKGRLDCSNRPSAEKWVKGTCKKAPWGL